MLVVILGHTLVMLTRVMDLSLQSVRTFFRKNMETCLEWLSHVRGHIVSIAIHAGMPAVAIRHGFAALKDLVKLHVRILCVCLRHCRVLGIIRINICLFNHKENLCFIVN